MSIPLNIIQRWMQSVIEHPGSNDDAWHSPDAQQQVPYDEALTQIVSSSALSAVDRIAIYRRMFFLRMTESMAADYPAVQQYLGEEEFDRIVMQEYLRQYPSRSYTLDHLGRYFPEFFRASERADSAFLAELAGLELAVTSVLQAEERPLVTQQQIAAVPPEAWERVRLVPISALSLRRFQYNVCSFLDSVTEGNDVPNVLHETTYAVIYRNAFRAYWLTVSEEQYSLLSDLIAGTPFGEALAHCSERFPDDERQLQTELFLWFNTWVRNGFFSGIRFE
jgi:hypothetical protein